MVEEDRYCIDVITQISAIEAALEKVALGLLDGHTRHCVLGPESRSCARSVRKSWWQPSGGFSVAVALRGVDPGARDPRWGHSSGPDRVCGHRVRVRREHIEEGHGVTDIGVPDPAEPEIVVIPVVEPVPGFVERPERRRRGARARAGMKLDEPILAWRSWRLRIDPETGRSSSCSNRVSTAIPGRSAEPSPLLPRPRAARSGLRLRDLRRDVARGRARVGRLGAVRAAEPDRPRPRAALGPGRPHSGGYRAELAYPYEIEVLLSEEVGAANARRLERLLRPRTSWTSPSAPRKRSR